MKTTTVKLPDELALRLEERARRSGMSKSKLIRDWIEAGFRASDEKQEEELSAYDLMKDGCGCVDSGVTDLATNPKHMEGFGR